MTLRARWVTLGARWVAHERFVKGLMKALRDAGFSKPDDTLQKVRFGPTRRMQAGSPVLQQPLHRSTLLSHSRSDVSLPCGGVT